MQSYQEMSKEELYKVKEGLEKEYAKYKGMGLSLNMARGKPAATQLDHALPLLHANVLIGLWMHFQTDFTARRNTHECHLQMAAGPQRCTKRCVLPCGSANRDGERRRSTVK